MKLGEDVSPLIQDEPVEISGVETRKTWRIHHFPARVKDPGKYRLDWESEELRWLEPGEAAHPESVPGLAQTIQSVWPNYPLSTSS